MLHAAAVDPCPVPELEIQQAPEDLAPFCAARGVFVVVRCDDEETWRLLEGKGHIMGRDRKHAMLPIPRHLLGLEAAKAAYDLGLETHVVEFAPRLMPRQIDNAGSRILVEKIESLGVRVHLNKSTKQVAVGDGIEGLVFADGQRLDVDMIIVSAGIRPRDELAKQAGLDPNDIGIRCALKRKRLQAGLEPGLDEGRLDRVTSLIVLGTIAPVVAPVSKEGIVEVSAVTCLADLVHDAEDVFSPSACCEKQNRQG